MIGNAPDCSHRLNTAVSGLNQEVLQLFGNDKDNIESRENEEEYSKATEAYLRIEPELSKTQREAVQRYIDTLQAADTDQTDNAYIAGIRDGIRFMVSFGLIEPVGKLPFNLDDMKAK